MRALGPGLTAHLLAAAVLAAPSPARAADPFAGCAARFAQQPGEYESSYCFFQVAQQAKLWDEAARRLDALMARHPENFWPALARGNVEWTRDLAHAERLYRAAALGFARQGNAEGEVLARYNLRTILFRGGRVAEAEAEVTRVMSVAEASGQGVLLARALTLRATHLTDTARDLDEAYRSLRRAEQSAGEDAPYTLRRSILFALGNACFQRGRFDEALVYYRRVDEMASGAGDLLSRATAQYSVVNTLMRDMEELPRPGGREEILRQARAALVAAVEAENREMQVLLHRTLGELLGGRSGERAEAEGHYARCMALARSLGQPRELAHCLWSLGSHLAGQGRASEARDRLDEAMALARQAGEAWSLAHGSRHSMRMSWRTRPREEATRESLAALRAIEALRRLPGDDAAAEVHSAWARDYYWLAGRLLDHGTAPAPRGDVARAFEVAERMRARGLLEALTAARAGEDLPRDHPLAREHREALERVVEVHRELLDHRLTGPSRRAALARLESLELAQEETRRALRAVRPRAAAYADQAFASLDEVEAGLGADEALLSFVVGLEEELGGESGGGAWLTVSTRRGSSVHRLPDRVRLQAIVPVFLGLFESRDGREAAAAASLYAELLAPALAALPENLARLVIVPDDALHHVPFAALRPAAGAEPLVARYEVALAPSATLWHRWRTAARAPASGRALVLADPAIGPNGAPARAPAQARGSALAAASSLGTLPHARAEGREIVRLLGHGSELWLGPAASEHALKAASLEPFAILHFAAHAVVDDERPDRSAVFLAPGSDREDGLLQLREVADLPLAGQAVVLSACRSASGSVLRGEGMVGLGRAFFQAGSHAVVGSLWPLRDDDAARLFRAFYRGLVRGSSVGAALRAAQREAIRDGLPAAAWAGLVAVGDGSLAPLPAPATAGTGTRRMLLAVPLLAAVALLWSLLRRRRLRRGV